MQETPAALQAFEDYWSLGDSRSFANLLKAYRERSDRGEEVPTVREGTIADWSREHGWQDRVKQRIEEEAERTREQMRKQADKFRRNLATAIEADAMRYVQRLSASGAEMMAQDATSLTKLADLYFKLVEQPLADRHEHSGPGGGAVQVEQSNRIVLDGEAALAVIAFHEGAEEDGGESDGEG